MGAKQGMGENGIVDWYLRGTSFVEDPNDCSKGGIDLSLRFCWEGTGCPSPSPLWFAFEIVALARASITRPVIPTGSDYNLLKTLLSSRNLDTRLCV